MVPTPTGVTVSKLRIALIGSRGIPANYGGYETLMEELSTRLVQRGHRVTVYCRSHYTSSDLAEHRGVELVVLPTLRTKHLDTPVHTFLSCLHAAQRDFDVALVVNSANAMFVPLLKAAEIPVALHVDGVERHRAKWGPMGRTVYRLAERWATHLPDLLITDAEVVRRYYLDRFDTDSRVITYGAESGLEPPGETMRQLGLQPGGYFLYVSRFEPENNPHRVVEAYAAVGGEAPLVMVGGAPYADKFIHIVENSADRRVLFPGFVYGRGYRELLSNPLAYVHATEVGGTHPALVEAMACGNCILVNETPENREVVDEAGIYFSAGSPTTLVAALERVLADPELSRSLSRLARERATKLFDWDRVSDRYEDLFLDLAELKSL